MEQLFTLLLVCFAAFAAGWLLCANVFNSVDSRMMRNDLRVISGLRGELQKHIDLYKAEKKRSAKLRASLRCANRVIRGEAPKWGRSLFRDPTLIRAHQLRQFFDELNKHSALVKEVGFEKAGMTPGTFAKLPDDVKP